MGGSAKKEMVDADRASHFLFAKNRYNIGVGNQLRRFPAFRDFA